MLDSLLTGFADISLAQLALIVATTLVTSVVGGVAGYGTGALMPLVLVPIVGPEPVVPIISLSALFTNTSRVAAFRHLVDYRKALIVVIAAVPTCALGAWGYTMLSGRGALIVIGSMLIASVPLRRLMRRRGLALTQRGLAAAAFALGTACRRHRRCRRHSALALDGGRARRRRRGGDRRGDLDRNRTDQIRSIRRGRRGERAGDRGRAAHRLRGVSRRLSRRSAWSTTCRSTSTPRSSTRW